MRVIAGEKRHLILKTLSGFDIRPTTDKIKETLFNMIQFDIANNNFLDLFAGSGAIGIEALSRGAKTAVFVDNNINAINVIKQNLSHTKLDDKSYVLHSDVISAFKKINDLNINFKFVFIDPPYNLKLYNIVLDALNNYKFVNNDTILIVESNINENFNFVNQIGYKIIKEKKYKNNKHTFLQRS